MDIERNYSIESGIGERRNPAQSREFSELCLGQHCPRHCPQPKGAVLSHPEPSNARSRLGPPLDIRQVAVLIGCSPWTVRNKLLPRGLPHFRSGASSKLIFFTHQIESWIERQQGGQRK